MHSGVIKSKDENICSTLHLTSSLVNSLPRYN